MTNGLVWGHFMTFNYTFNIYISRAVAGDGKKMQVCAAIFMPMLLQWHIGLDGPLLSRKWTVNTRAWRHLLRVSLPSVVSHILIQPRSVFCFCRGTAGNDDNGSFGSGEGGREEKEHTSSTHWCWSRCIFFKHQQSPSLQHRACVQHVRHSYAHTFMLQPPQTGRLLSDSVPTSHRIIHSWLLGRPFVTTATRLSGCRSRSGLDELQFFKGSVSWQGKKKLTRDRIFNVIFKHDKA